MESFLIGICVVAALLATGAAVFFWRQSGIYRGDLQSETARREAAELARNSLQAEAVQAQAEKAAAVERAQKAAELSADNEQLRERAAKAEEQARSAQKQAEETKASLTEMHKKMSVEFENLSHKVLKEQSQIFGKDSKKILEPLERDLEQFRNQAVALHTEQTRGQESLKEKIAGLQKNTEQVSRDANTLALALKGDSKTQGDWGEVSLAMLLEKSGLSEGEGYKAQAAVRSEDGKNQRPDVVIYLPDNKHLIVDSKVSLRDYHDFVAAEDADSQKRALARHVKAVKNHIAGLSAKHYAAASGINAPDFVFMFMPVEPAFFAALKESPPLFSDAYDKNIVLCAPTTLMAILQTVERIWRTELQNKNAMEISRQGANLYDKFRGFLESMSEIDHALAGARRAYDKAQKQLSEGGGNLVGRVEKLRELGVKPKKLLPRVQSSAAEDPDEKEE